MPLWKINCSEDRYPGMWQRWFRNQCVGVGWHAEWGFHLTGPTDGGRGWSRARNVLQHIKTGDHIVVALQGNRVGRLGEVTGMAVGDNEWNPLVPPSKDLPQGEMGRRLLVRWNLTIGPDDREMVVAFPEERRFTPGELRPTLCEIRSMSLDQLLTAMSDPANWVALLAHFDYERALSGYIAAYPHRLEDGLLQHPNDKVRERVFADRSRLDVLLLDRDDRPVIVECKQNSPSVQDVQQLRHYMNRLQEETGLPARGLLVHGGARRLRREVASAAAQKPPVEVVQYRLDVDFSASH